MRDYNKFIEDLIIAEPDIHCGGRKLYLNRTLVVRDFHEVEYNLDDMGYTSMKWKMLMSAYWNEESASKAKQEIAKFKTRDNYSIGFHTHGIEKTRGQKGFCIQAMTFVKEPDGKIRLNVFYRTVEILKKFYADLVFIQDQVLPYFGLKPYQITFYFSTLTLNTLYIPVMVDRMPNFEETIAKVRETDPKFFRMMGRVASAYLAPGKNGFMQIERGKLNINTRNRPLLEYLAASWKKTKHDEHLTKLRRTKSLNRNLRRFRRVTHSPNETLSS